MTEPEVVVCSSKELEELAAVEHMTVIELLVWLDKRGVRVRITDS